MRPKKHMITIKAVQAAARLKQYEAVQAAAKLRVGDKVRAVNIGERYFQLLHSRRNRLVQNKVYTVAWIDKTLGNIGLKNKGSNWSADRFEPVSRWTRSTYTNFGKI